MAGKFAYGVMGLSAATFAFWATVGTRLFPQVLAGAAAGPAGTLLLSLQVRVCLRCMSILQGLVCDRVCVL